MIFEGKNSLSNTNRMHLTKGTENQKIKLYGLDHLRSFAIAFVFLFHYGRLFPHPDWTNTISKFGWTGVDLFFVLSGFLIASQLFATIAKNEIISFKTFFIKRFFRIIPLYLFTLTLYFLFPIVREREALAPLWKYLTFTHNIGLDLRSQGTFSHAWSLCIEEQFYLLLPIILIGLTHFKLKSMGFYLLTILYMSCFLVRLYSWNTLVLPFKEMDDFWAYWYKWIYYPTYCRLDGLLVGVTIAASVQFAQEFTNWVNRFVYWVLLLGIVTLVIAYNFCLDQESFIASIWGFPLVSLGYGLLVWVAICPASFLYKLQSKFSACIASLSYSIYLIHKIIVHLTQEILSSYKIEKEGNLMFILCISTTLLVSFLMQQLIEKPFMKWRDYILRKRETNNYH